jgi:A118 family predicted phage portal protein
MADNQFEVPSFVRDEIVSRGYAMPPSMADHIERWYQWYTCTAPWYVEHYAGLDGRRHKRDKLSLRPARRVCREWASLIANEMGARSDAPRANAWVRDYCARESLFVLFQRGIERTFAMGTGAMALWFDVREDGTDVKVRRYDAKMVIPLTWDEDGTTECALCTRATIGGRPVTQLQLHVMDGTTGTYHVVTVVWDKDGRKVSPEGIITDFDTGCETPTFCLLSPAIDNTLQDTSPYGVSVFEDAIGAMKLLDTAWTALYDETDLLRAVLMVPDTMIDVEEVGPDGTVRAVPFGDQEQRLYRKTASAVGEEGKPYAFTPAMRTSSIYEAYAAACAALGDECGFGSQYFRPDRQAGLKTATEVSADNSALMRNTRNHEAALGRGLGTLLTSLATCARTCCGADVEEGALVSVTWDDSIITDIQTDKAQMLSEISAGVVPKWMYLVRFYGMDEDEAKATLPEPTAVDYGF